MRNQKLAEEKLNTYHQESILNYLDQLDDRQKQEMINQILQIDFKQKKK